MSRRDFIKRVGLLGAAAATAGLESSCTKIEKDEQVGEGIIVNKRIFSKTGQHYVELEVNGKKGVVQLSKEEYKELNINEKISVRYNYVESGSFRKFVKNTLPLYDVNIISIESASGKKIRNRESVLF